MHLGIILAPLLFLGRSAAALNVLSTNDDGWAEANIRAQFNSLVAAGFNVKLSMNMAYRSN
jgi:hypothetical protein